MALTKRASLIRRLQHQGSAVLEVGCRCASANVVNHDQSRTDRIRQRHEAGDSIDEIASASDVSWEALGRITRKFETEAVLSARGSRFLENIRKANDPDKRWKVSCLVQALRPQVMTQNAIIHHFRWSKTPEISLRQLMDVTISEQEHPKAGWLVAPLLEFRCVGLRGFWSMVRQLTESDLGEKSNEEWRKRLARLKQASRIVGGGRLSWSKACEPPAWLVSLRTSL